MTNATNTDNLSATLTLTNGRWPVAGDTVRLEDDSCLRIEDVGYCDGHYLNVTGYLVEPDLLDDDELCDGVTGALD